MDINSPTNRANYSAINGFSPKLAKTKPFGNWANSNAKAVGIQKKKQVAKKRKGGKKRPLGYKQNMG